MTAPASVLIAEDDKKLQELAKRALERHGYSVTQAFDSTQLWAHLVAAVPDLIVLDVGLPDADGRDILAALKRDPKTSAIPVLVWSGRDGGSERRIALDLGAEDFLEKGPPSELVSKIDRILLRLSERIPLA